MHIFLWDIDGTLISSAGAGQAAMEAALAAEFGVTAPTEGVPSAGRTDRAITRDLFAYHGIPETPENWEKFVTCYLGHLKTALAERQGRVLPGIQHVIEQLGARSDVALGLLTGNVREGARHKLSRYELLHHFHFGGYGDLHFDRNDVAREAYREVHKHLPGKVNLDRLWVIGDTPFDVICGRAIGARVIAVATGGHTVEQLTEAKPDHVFADFSNPATLLELWN